MRMIFRIVVMRLLASHSFVGGTTFAGYDPYPKPFLPPPPPLPESPGISVRGRAALVSPYDGHL